MVEPTLRLMLGLVEPLRARPDRVLSVTPAGVTLRLVPSELRIVTLAGAVV